MNTKYTPLRARVFINTLEDTCNITAACRAAGITRRTAYNWKERHPEFGADWQRALDIAISVLEDEVTRRAFEGFEDPVFYQGRQCGTVRKYSDTLAIFFLKAHLPEKYRERTETNLNVKGELDIAARLAAGRKRVGG